MLPLYLLEFGRTLVFCGQSFTALISNANLFRERERMRVCAEERYIYIYWQAVKGRRNKTLGCWVASLRENINLLIYWDRRERERHVKINLVDKAWVNRPFYIYVNIIESHYVYA